MMKNLMNILFLAITLSTTLFMTSCSDDAALFTPEDSENFVDQAVFAVQAEANAGKFGCFEFVFPVSISFPDGTTSEVADYETLKAEMKAWYEANAESLGLVDADGNRTGTRKHDIDPALLPSLAFPVEVVSAEGEAITVADRDELRTLKKSCKRSFYGNKGNRGHRKGDKCFKLVFPLSVDFPDGTSAEAADRRALKMAIRTWKSENPDATERPSLQFPVTVELEDGTTQDVASKEDLEALKESCSAD